MDRAPLSTDDWDFPLQPSMIEIRRGDLFDADVEALVNPVHCAGIMKRGLCRHFKTQFPANTKTYKAACDAGTLRPGDVLVHDRGGLFGDQDRPRYVLNVATKDHWTDSARLADIETGADAVVEEVRTRDISSVAVPAVGCGGGGLAWTDVRPRLTDSLAALDNSVRTLVYAPRSAGTTPSRDVPESRPAMTKGRALLLGTLDAYADPDDALRPHAAHNLAYLLQCAGEDLQLEFDPGPYGLSAPGLTAVLERIDGHFVEGYDADHQNTPFRLRPPAVAEATNLITAASDAADRLQRVRHLLDDVSSDDDLELLATVLWLLRHDPEARRRAEAAVRAVHDWSRRKARFSSEQIAATWRQLRDHGWVD